MNIVEDEIFRLDHSIICQKFLILLLMISIDETVFDLIILQ